MHITVVFPITDLRRLLAPSTVLDKPSWTVPGEFVRGFGEIEPAVPNDALADAFVCPAEKALKLAQMPSLDFPERMRKVLQRQRCDFTLATEWPNRRLFHDGRFTARYEITFTGPSYRSRNERIISEQMHDTEIARSGLVRELVEKVARTQVHLSKKHASAWQGQLTQAGPEIAKALQRATAPANRTGVKGAQSRGDACIAHKPLMLVSLFEEDFDQSLPNGKIIADWGDGRIESLPDVNGARVLALRLTDRASPQATLANGLTRFHAYSEAAASIARTTARASNNSQDRNVIATLTSVFDLESRITDRLAMLQPSKRAPDVRAPGVRQAGTANGEQIGHLSAISEIWQPPATRRLMPLLKPPPRRGRFRRWLSGDSGYAAFISYRRQDAEFVQSVRLSLEQSLGKKAIFFDLTCLDPGAEFPERLIESLLESRSVVVVIGRNWLGQRSDHEQMRGIM